MKFVESMEPITKMRECKELIIYGKTHEARQERNVEVETLRRGGGGSRGGGAGVERLLREPSGS